MDNEIMKFTEEIIKDLKKKKSSITYKPLGLNFNPFPPAGLPRFLLPPFDESYADIIMQFIRSTYLAPIKQDYAGLTIIGDYGMGKTHLMKYIKEVIDKLSNGALEERKDVRFSAVTCFVDKPDDAPQIVIHKIVEQIGIDNIRKYIGRILLSEFSKDKKAFIGKFRSKQPSLFDSKSYWDKLFEEPAISNFLEFLSRFKEVHGELASLQEAARDIIRKEIVPDSTLADRYLDLVFEEKKAATSWDILAGYVSNRNIQKKEVMFLNSIVGILKHVGFHQLYVFVDEFEDVSKLKGAKLSNYLITLNTLINKEGRWALVVSLTKDAIVIIKKESAPLYDRLTSFAIKLDPLNQKKAKKMIVGYLNLARTTAGSSILPFTDETIKEMLNIAEGNCRSFILLAHKVLDEAIRKNKTKITSEIVVKAKRLRYEEKYDQSI
ncbi:MAG: hypothetical protein M0R20_05680 [Candidatus Omnitrophica bacterium]|jgi:hypothetical protein|nr:hypothetical protein [Candidatus Omnitrophota bacterium]